MRRRHFLQTTALTSLLAACGRPGREPDSEETPWGSKPNIVLVMADDLGYGHVGCYGQTVIATPHIDRLAADGVRFTDAYAGCTVCAPSRSALMTGLHTGHTPVRSNDGGIPLPAGTPTIATILKAAGYRTGCFGKWGLGSEGTEGMPTRHGFDEFLGPLHQVHAQYYYPDHLWRNESRMELPGNRDGGQQQYAPDVIHEAALAFLRETTEPFFLYIPSMIPHHEFQSPERTLAPYRDRFEETPFIRDDRGFVPQPRPAEHFAGMVARLDEQVGELRQTLEELGRAENTLFLFTSDNGPIGDTPSITNSFDGAGPFRGFKRDLYEGGIRVPLIAFHPGALEAGRETSRPVASWDFLPTFAELAGTVLPEGYLPDGVSQVRAFYSEETDPVRPPLYWETGSGATLKQAVRVAEWKVVRLAPGEPLELYNLTTDPGESRNVASQNAGLIAEFESYLETARVDPPPQVEPGWQR
jgi:arylsulfatase A